MRGGRIPYGSASCFAPLFFYRYMPDTTPATALTDTAAAPVAALQPTPKPRRRRPPTLSWSAWKQFMSVARPYWLGDQKRMAWGLLALLVGLMVLETQLAVMLIDKTGELTSALAAKQVDRFWSAVRPGRPAPRSFRRFCRSAAPPAGFPAASARSAPPSATRRFFCGRRASTAGPPAKNGARRPAAGCANSPTGRAGQRRRRAQVRQAQRVHWPGQQGAGARTGCRQGLRWKEA